MFEKLTQYFERRRMNADVTDFLTSPLAVNPNQIAFLTSLAGQSVDLPAKAVTDMSVPKRYRQESNQDGIGVIPIYGILEHRRSLFSLLFGGTSYDQVRAELTEAVEDPSIKSVLLDIDSPGGQVSGMLDLADIIYQARNFKSIYAMVNENAYSAAYALASAASKVFIPQTGGLGSIGVISLHVDKSKANEKAGLQYTTIIAGEKKADFSPNEPLSKRARDDAQKTVDNMRYLFAQAVARNRGISLKSILDTEAGIFQGQKAVDIGLADGVMSYSDVIQQISQGATKPAGSGSKKFSSASFFPSKAIGTTASTVPNIPIVPTIPATASVSGLPEAEAVIPSLPANVGTPGADFQQAINQERERCVQVFEQLAAVADIMPRGAADLLLSQLLSSGATPEMAGQMIVSTLAGQQANSQVISSVSALSTGDVNPLLRDAQRRAQSAKDNKYL